MKRTKIIATIGPACENPKILTKMVQSGMNVARLNFSHGSYKNHASLMKSIRTVSKKLDNPIAIIQDLQGPKIRVGKVAKPFSVKKGQAVVLGKDFDMDYDISRSVKKGDRILIEDGLMEFIVTKVTPSKPGSKKHGTIACEVINGGLIASHKGANLPDSAITFPILTHKDLDDLKFGLKNDVDYIALSFVRSARDIENLKKLIKKHNPKGKNHPKIIAKIERPEAVKHFDSILKVADAIMIARGDLGVEMPADEVPIIQKTIIEKCLKASKPVIVATQMLDSMIRNPRPTRAEVSDVANAVIDQTDCVMLSGETAYGKYPVQAVSEMTKVIETTEKSMFIPAHKHLLEKVVSKSEAVAEGVFDLAVHTKAKVIIGASDSGFTARSIARMRPYHQKLVVLTPNQKTLRQVSMIWGVEAYLVPKARTFEALIKSMMRLVLDNKLAKKGEKVILVTGEPLGVRENLNMVEVREVR